MDLLESPHFAGLTTFCEKLRAEKLLINHEQSILRSLNSKIESGLNELYKLVWICRHEQEILHQLINSDLAVSPENCCQLFNQLNSAVFIEAYRNLNQFAGEIIQVFKLLNGAPRAVASFLNAAERLNSSTQSINELCSSIFNILYGSCLFPEDEMNILELLGHLITLQLVQSPDPRKVLRKGNSAFSKMYKTFSESLSSTKIFLTAALHEPIMFLLSQDELFLDIDPSKSPIRIPAAERRRRFGPDENSRSYKEKVAQHRRIIVDKLVAITERFINSILNAMSSFPGSITWLVGQMYTALIEKKLINKEEAALICTDLIFTYFICSAVINPEPLGIISDTPISYIARFNLMQIGQILQTLAILPYEQRFPAYFGEILSRIDRESMTLVMNRILHSESASIETIFPIQVPDSKGKEAYRRRAFVGTIREVNVLQSFLKSPAIEEINDAALRKSLKNILKKLPEEFNENPIQPLVGYQDMPEKSPLVHTPSTRLKSFADKVQIVASRSHQRLMQTSSVSNLRNLHQRLPNSSSSNVLNSENLSASSVETNGSLGKQEINANKNQIVLIFSMSDNDGLFGMASEDEIMDSLRRIESKRKKFADGQKKTRFLTATESIISDRTATDVVSDEEEEEEEIDEAAVGSSMSSSNENAEEEAEDISTLPDNFSDVVPISANVSGRGSPSLSGGRLSGRETPFSGNTAEQNNDTVTVCSTIPAIATQPVEPRRTTLPPIPVTVKKQNTEGLEEKFGKFALPPQDPSSRYRDETVSLVSDSWSTDVVASDNEGLVELKNAEIPPSPSMPPNNPPPPPLPLPMAPPMLPLQLPQNQQIGNRSLQASTSGMATNRQNLNVINGGGPAGPSVAQQQQDNTPNNSLMAALLPQAQAIPSTDIIAADGDKPYFDPNNLTRCRAFLDAKRKLRLVLSCTSTMPIGSNEQQNDDTKILNGAGTLIRQENEANALQQLLKQLLAESINARDRKQASQIREVQRCLSIFDSKGIATLLRIMKREQRKRNAYLMYLQQSKLTLLQLNYCIERMNKRIRRDKDLTAECLIEMLVRFSLQKKDTFLRQFVQEFQRQRVQDEKIELVESHLRHLYEQLVVESIWRHATLENIEYARKCLERSLMAQIYIFALFPNAEADFYRDEVLTKSIQQLSTIISVDHPELAIPKSLHAECPWPSAQAELSIINAYKSPRDKMACITRCCETIENLIILSSGRSTAAADDILPILVFVILKANPPALLSNLQFIEGFYAKRMQGSEAYWWTQFCSAVEFLKTLLHKLCN